VKHVVLGAGPLGTSLARMLATGGNEVALFSVMGNTAYDMPGTSPAALDGTDVRQLTRACEGAAFVYLCLNAHYVDWQELFPPRLEAAIETAASVGAKLVYRDDVYMYGPVDEPLTEEMEYAATTRKGRLRAAMATSLLDAVRAGKVRAVIGRSADMYGPGALNSSFNSTLGQRHFHPLLAGKAVNILGDIDKPHTYAYVDDVAGGLIELAERDEALGQAWHIPAAPTLSHRKLMTLAFKEAGLPPKIRGSKVFGYFVRAIGRFQRDVGEVSELLYQFENPLVVSHRKYEEAFGATPTPHDEALSRTLAWYRDNP
jgi:nucleoside-diphosphate-sugar epimerase